MSKLIYKLEEFIYDLQSKSYKLNDSPYDRVCLNPEQIIEIQNHFLTLRGVVVDKNINNLMSLNINGLKLSISPSNNTLMYVIRKLIKPERISDLVGYMADDIKVSMSGDDTPNRVDYPSDIVPIYCSNSEYEFGECIPMNSIENQLKFSRFLKT